MSIIEQIRFRDLDQQEKAEVRRIQDRLSSLDAARRKRELNAVERAEFDQLSDVLEAVQQGGEVCQPLFIGARDLFNQNEGILGAKLVNHESGTLVHLESEAIIKASLALGLLMYDRAAAPAVKTVAAPPKPPPSSNTPSDQGATATAKKPKTDPKTIVTNTDDPAFETLSRSFFAAVGEATGAYRLASRVLPILAIEGDPDGRGGTVPTVEAAEFARVVRALRDKGVTADEPQLRRRVNEALDDIQAVGDNRTIVNSVLDLPDLESIAANDFSKDLIQLAGAGICSAMIDELKGYEVVDKLVELFQSGMLPIGPGEAGKMLYTYWKETPNRMSDAERKNFYAITMGIPGGSTDNAMVNREFNDLWLRFVSSVSNFVRQNEVDNLLRASVPSAVSQQAVRKSARDLAGNLSLHGYGMAYYAALEMQDQIKFMIKLLSDPEIRSAYGAKDMWQVIDQVATLELGGAKNSSRYRTLATCGTIITAWLANNIARISEPTGVLIDMDSVRYPAARASGQKATTDPNDYDLVNACELWLADTATSDDRIEEMSQPREAPVMTSKPVQIPAIAREMLDGLGGGVGLGLGSTSRH